MFFFFCFFDIAPYFARVQHIGHRGMDSSLSYIVVAPLTHHLQHLKVSQFGMCPSDSALHRQNGQYKAFLGFSQPRGKWRQMCREEERQTCLTQMEQIWTERQREAKGIGSIWRIRHGDCKLVGCRMGMVRGFIWASMRRSFECSGLSCQGLV